MPYFSNKIIVKRNRTEQVTKELHVYGWGCGEAEIRDLFFLEVVVSQTGDHRGVVGTEFQVRPPQPAGEFRREFFHFLAQL